MLTEIPGWPDAPKKVRVRRSLPILVPCVVILLLLVWNKTVRDPSMRNERASHQALLDQDKEIDALRMSISEQEAAELAAKSAKAERQILKDPAEVAPILKKFKDLAVEKHWEGSFQPSDLSTGTAPDSDAQLVFSFARAKLASPPENPQAFSSLLALIDQFSAADKRIDLTRLDIRADEQGRYLAELNFRFVRRASHEKTP